MMVECLWIVLSINSMIITTFNLTRHGNKAINVLKYVGNDFTSTTDRIQCLSNDVINLEDKKRNLLDKVIV